MGDVEGLQNNSDQIAYTQLFLRSLHICCGLSPRLTCLNCVSREG
jgi:hypothetical protein